MVIPNPEDNKILRELLWLRHGCPIVSLYGDDGERQCNHCKIDFKRDDPAEIRDKFERMGKEQYLASLKEGEGLDIMTA